MTTGANAVEDAFKKQSETGKSQMDIAKNNMEALSITIGTQLLPIITKLVQKVVPVIQNVIKWTKENPKLFKTLIVGAAAVAGLAFAVSAIAGGIALVTKAIAAWGLITKIFTGVQWLMNAALAMNPIGLIVIAILAMIAVVTIVIAKYNEWGAALTFLLGPIGFVINLIQSFRRNWDMITESFKTGGVLAGFKAIGVTILDAILMPLQQVFKLMTNLPGVGDFAKKAVAEIEMWRSNMGVNVTTDESGDPIAKPLNPRASDQESLMQKLESTNNAKVAIDIKDPNNRTKASSDNQFVKINTSSTMAWGQ
jgi:phage-related tail protein